MGNTLKLSVILLFIALNYQLFLINEMGQLYAFIGAVGHSPATGRTVLADKRGPIEGDKELEDTIREISRYTLSDSLWRMWRAIEDSQFTVAKIDSLSSLKSFVKGVKLAKEGFDLITKLKQEQMDSLTARKIKFKAILLFEKARTHFEETFRLNPYDIRTQNYLVWVFQNLAELHDHCSNTLRAINMLECLTYILHDDPKLYYTLGEKYFHVGRWDRALVCIKTSIDLILDDDWNKIDTKQLFWHYDLKASAEIQMNMIQEALLSLHYAKLIAPSEIEAADMQKKMDWINWDDGNLDASRKSDTLNYRLLTGEGDYSRIKLEYLDLLNQVQSVRAQQDINWRIAQLEFKFLNEREKAIERMLNIVKQVPLDSIKRAQNPELQKYLDDFGSMCYILGMEHLNSNNYKRAFIYFYQSTEFWWTQIGKSYLQLAKLSSLDNSATLKFSKLALNNEHHLTTEERNSLYYIIFLAYKRLGLFEEANKWFQIINNFTSGS